LAAAPPPRVAAEHGLAPTHAVWASDGTGLPSGPHASALPRVAAEHVLAKTHAVEDERWSFVDLVEEEATRTRQRQEEGDAEEAWALVTTFADIFDCLPADGSKDVLSGHTPAVDAVAGQAMEESDWAPTRMTLAAAPPPRVAAEHGLAPTHAVWASDEPGLPSGPHAPALPRVAAEHVLAPTHAVEHERRAFVDLAEEEATRNRQRQEEGDAKEAWASVTTFADLFDCLRADGSNDVLSGLRRPQLELEQEQMAILRHVADTIMFDPPAMGEASGAAEHAQEMHGQRGPLLAPAWRVRGDQTSLLLAMEEILSARDAVTLGRVHRVLTETETADTWTAWRKKWQSENLLPHQIDKSTSKKQSIFNAAIRNRFGSVALARAIISCGATIMPSGAAEHGRTAARFATEQDKAKACLAEVTDWLRAFSSAYAKYKEDPATERAQARSRGLSTEESAARIARDRARESLRMARRLEREVGAWDSWAKGGRSEERMQRWERELLRKYRSGLLDEELVEAEGNHGGAVAARPFRVEPVLQSTVQAQAGAAKHGGARGV